MACAFLLFPSSTSCPLHSPFFLLIFSSINILPLFHRRVLHLVNLFNPVLFHSHCSSPPSRLLSLVLVLYNLFSSFCAWKFLITPSHPTFFLLYSPYFVFFVFLGHQSSLCSPYDIIQCRLQPVYATVQVLVALDTASLDRKRQETISTSNSTSSRGSKCRSVVSVTTQTPPPSWQIWDLIGSSLLHILCLTLLFVAYSWIELT